MSWVRRLTTDDNANWKILPKLFYNNTDLQLYFNANQEKIKNSLIPTFYRDIHNMWMCTFKKYPTNYKEVLEESLWLNRYITSNNKTLFWKTWIDNGILKIGQLLDSNGIFLSHSDISKKYDVPCNFLHILQIRQSLPLEWRQLLNNDSNMRAPNLTNKHLIVKVNKTYIPIQKVSCKQIYWQIIYTTEHVPTAKLKWSKIYKEFENASDDIWERIYSLSFNITRETKLQSFQYKIIHRIIACNKWLYNIKIKQSGKCSFCDCEDSIQHFLITCDSAYNFWEHWFNWWQNTSDLDIKNHEHTEECILFGYPGHSDLIAVLNYCVIVAKYFIYIEKMLGKNQMDFYKYLILLKQKLKMEKYACQNEGKSFEKFDFVLSSL